MTKKVKPLKHFLTSLFTNGVIKIDMCEHHLFKLLVFIKF